MNWRFVVCAVWAAVSSTVPRVLYADQQACETLVAVSYFTVPLAVEDQDDQQVQRNISLEFLKTLAKKTQLSIKVDAAEGQKALAEVRSGRVDLIIGVSLEPEKDPRLDYLSPAYAQKTYRLWLRTGEQVSLKQWPELSGLRGVRVMPPARLIDFDLQAQLLNWPVRTAQSLQIAIAKVQEGRADYVVAEQQSMQQYLVEHDLTRRFEAVDPPVETQGRFVAIAKDSACNTAGLRSTLNKALAQLAETQ